MRNRLAFVAAVMAAAACGRGGGAATQEQATAPAPPPGVRAAPVIDSHVHLSYLRAADRLARAGVLGAVDLGAPIGTVGNGEAPLAALVQAGPMLTSPGGYPINAWDPGGYGQACTLDTCVEATVAAIAARGGRVVKLVVAPDGLDATLVPHAVHAAHQRGMKVAVHALGDDEAQLAAKQDCDVLAHTPVEPLTDETIAAWRGRAVVSTLAAFGGRETTVENLRKLRAGGVTVLYGTDLGNTQTPAVDPDELKLLRAAGLDDAAIVAAMTTTPAAYWGITFDDDTYVRLARDPARDADAYLEPLQVWADGKQLR
ncbi:MAG TPA: hypothetical protein VM261_02550 [Kofleriaceae bacterium]|nr:hypothetical protein [Kofleriaceae bacterium]